MSDTSTQDIRPARGNRIMILKNSGAMGANRKRLALSVRLEVSTVERLHGGGLEITGFVLLANGDYPRSGDMPMRTVTVDNGTLGTQWEWIGEPPVKTPAQVRDDIDFHRAFCHVCGVNPYGAATVERDASGAAVAQCVSCPADVDFTTAYPVGTEIMITDGFAAGAVVPIERVGDAYPTEPDGVAYYAGRCYTVTLPHWGRRSFQESIVRPTDDAMISRYAVARDVPAAPVESDDVQGTLPGTDSPVSDMWDNGPVVDGFGCTTAGVAAHGHKYGCPDSGTDVAGEMLTSAMGKIQEGRYADAVKLAESAREYAPTGAVSGKPVSELVDAVALLVKVRTAPGRLADDAMAAFQGQDYARARRLAATGAAMHPDYLPGGIAWIQVMATIDAAMGAADEKPVDAFGCLPSQVAQYGHRDGCVHVAQDADVQPVLHRDGFVPPEVDYAPLSKVSVEALTVAFSVMSGDPVEAGKIADALSVCDRRERAAAKRAAAKREFGEAVEGRFEKAEKYTRGHMLNPRGIAENVNPRSLFEGPETRVKAFASEELQEYFAQHGRMTRGDYQAAMAERRPVAVTLVTEPAPEPAAPSGAARVYALPRPMRGPQLKPVRRALAAAVSRPTGVVFTVSGGTSVTVEAVSGPVDSVDWDLVGRVVVDALAGMVAVS